MASFIDLPNDWISQWTHLFRVRRTISKCIFPLTYIGQIIWYRSDVMCPRLEEDSAVSVRSIRDRREELDVLRRFAKLPRMERDTLMRMIAVRRSYNGDVPNELEDAINTVLDSRQRTRNKCERLKLLLDSWAPLH